MYSKLVVGGGAAFIGTSYLAGIDPRLIVCAAVVLVVTSMNIIAGYDVLLHPLELILHFIPSCSKDWCKAHE